MYKAKLVKHVRKDMQLADENGKIVFKASVDVAVDNFINNIPALSKNIKGVYDKLQKLNADIVDKNNSEEILESMRTIGEFTEELSKFINTYLITILGAAKAHELLMACDNRALDAYCAIVPFVEECIAPEIQNEMNKNMARIESIMK